MEPSLVEAFIFKTVCYVACLAAAAIYVFTRTTADHAQNAFEPEPSVAEAEPPVEPDRHGGVKCDGCGKDDPARMVFVVENCQHVVCELCVKLPPKQSLLERLQLCSDQVYRVQLCDAQCKVCSKKGFLRPPMLPVVRQPPKVTAHPRVFRSASSRVVVEVIVGARTSDSDTFFAPECILTARSKVFARRLEGNTNSAREKRLRLPDHDPKTFNYVLEFMYSGTIPDETTGDDSKPTMYDFFDIWALASFLEMDELCNYCAWSILMRYDATRKLDMVKLRKRYIVKDASELMKKLVLDLRVWTKEGIKINLEPDWPSDFLREAANTLRRRVSAIPSVNPLDRVENYYIPTPAPPTPPPPTPPPPPAVYPTRTTLLQSTSTGASSHRTTSHRPGSRISPCS